MGFDMDWIESSDATKDESYFRAAMGSMGRLREVMLARGMTGYNGQPSIAEAKVDFHAFAANGGDFNIPIMKLSSNDGWVVHPAEIRAALATNDVLRPITQEELGDPDWWDLERWERWLTFLRGAAEHGGFEVW